MFRDLCHWETTIEEHAQVRIVHTFDEYESARWLVAKHSWWTSKSADEHKSLKQFHVLPPPAASIVKPGLMRRIAKELAGVGWDKSIAVEAKFGSVREMINANEQTWQQIEGIGKVIAARIIRQITGGK